MIEFDELWRGGPKLARTEDSFRLSTDSVLLAHFVNMPNPRAILDLGSGAAVLSVLLADKYKSAALTGVEIQERSVQLSRLSIAESGFSDRIDIINADLREHRSILPAGGFDLVVSNPPYFPVAGGYSAPNEARQIAREEVCCSLSDVCAAAAYLCRWGGSFSLVHRPERLAEICKTASGFGLEPKRLRTVHHKAAAAPSLILLDCRRGAKPGLVFEPPLILANEDGSDSAETIEIYHR